MTNYRIAWGNAEAVEKEVSELLQNGWIPHGGVAINVDENGAFSFAQAMIKD